MKVRIFRENETIEVELSYFAPMRGTRDSFGGRRGAGPPLEPDDDEHFEIEYAIRLSDGAEVDLTSKEEAEAQKLAWLNYTT